MNKEIFFNFLIDKETHQVTVERSFNAPLTTVWAAWTEAEILDQWWAPRPWRAETKSQNFKVGGRWHYCMVSPDEKERHWCLFDYESIELQKMFSGIDAFCDENEVANDIKPRVRWRATFTATPDDATFVNIDLEFLSLNDLEQIMAMGFKEGFTMGLNNLDELLASL